jgi:hypothetical protein
MKIYTKKSAQKLPITLQEAWDFISNPKNLAVITPPEMGFKTLSGDERKMFPGQIIHYTITPLFGIKMLGDRDHAHGRQKILCRRTASWPICILAPQAFFKGNSRRCGNGRHRAL